MNLLMLTAAFIAGLFGSVHCLAMCGGIAVTLGAGTSDRPSWWHAITAAVSLNLGRVVGYTLAGVLVGAFGTAVLGITDAPSVANALRWLVGAVMILVALRLADIAGHWRWLSLPGQGVWAVIARVQSALKYVPQAVRAPLSGVLWAFLPCGLSSTMLFAAWFEADALRSSALMLAFGLGTMPMMVLLSATGQRSRVWLLAPASRRIAAGLIATFGVITLAAPWLHGLHPAMPGVLAAMGCSATT